MSSNTHYENTFSDSITIKMEARRNWGDEVDELTNGETLPATTKTTDSNGIVTIVEWRWADMEQHQKIKTTRRIRTVTKREKVDHQVAARKRWSKFGSAVNDGVGPNVGTTQLAEAVTLKLTLGKNWHIEAEEEKKKSNNATGLSLANAENSQVTCRTCKGNHWTSRCPYKDTLGADAAAATETPAEGAEEVRASTSGRYVPPSMRAGNGSRASLEEAAKAKEDACTIRVTNLTKDMQDADLRDLCSRFGRITRAFLSKDKMTGECKGFAFVTYEDKRDAQRALDHLHGFGYDSLILHVEWAKYCFTL